MKIIQFILSLCFVLLFHSITAQTKVMDMSELSGKGSYPAVPDVNGKVLVSSDYLQMNASKGSYLSLIELYPNWPLSYTGSSQRGGVYCNLGGDDDLEIVYCVSQQVYAWNIDGTLVEGWPQTVLQYPDGAPAFGDIDGDGDGEIVVSSRQAGTGNTGTLTAFHTDGTLVDGFPVSMTGGATKTPVLADLNSDGSYEIIIEERAWPDGYVGVYSGDGSAYPGFPVMLDYIPASSVAVGDITGDNIPEIVAESYYSIYAFDVDGEVLEGFPFTPENDRVFSYSSPVLADLDGDGYREIIAGDHSLTSGNGAVHVLKNDGSPMDGWPQYTSNWIYGPPAVGDIDGDGNLDIAVGDQVLATTPSDKVYAWDNEGNTLDGWPTSNINAINNQIILADLDGDNQVELMWDDNSGDNKYLGYNHDGTPMEGWPLLLNGSSFFMNPFVVDLNNDGDLDISGASSIITDSDLNFYLWNGNVAFNADHSPLTILQYNVRHDGTYLDASILNAAFTASEVEICEGSAVQFNDQSNGAVTSWEWAFEGGDPASSTDQNPVVTYDNSGNFEVSLSVSDGTTSSSNTIDDFIDVAYEAEAPDQPFGPSNFSTDTANITYYETWAPNADEYIWELVPENVGVLVAGDTITKIKIYWSTDLQYYAELRVKAVNVCGESMDSEPLTIYVNWSVGTNEQVTSNPFEIYPNPSSGKFTIRLTEDVQVGAIKIFNIHGGLVKNYTSITKQTLQHIDKMEAGIYYLGLEINGKAYFEKLIIQ